MFNIIGMVISGLFVGALARWFYPGAVEMGWLATIGLGIAGSLVMGLLFNRGRNGFQPAGCLGSIIGAMALIFIGSLLGISF